MELPDRLFSQFYELVYLPFCPWFRIIPKKESLFWVRVSCVTGNVIVEKEESKIFSVID